MAPLGARFGRFLNPIVVPKCFRAIWGLQAEFLQAKVLQAEFWQAKVLQAEFWQAEVLVLEPAGARRT